MIPNSLVMFRNVSARDDSPIIFSSLAGGVGTYS